MDAVRRLCKLLFWVALPLMAASCSSDEFKVDASIEGLVDEQVRVLYAVSETLTDTWVPAPHGRLRIKGKAEHPTVLYLLGFNGNLLARAVVDGGDRLTLKAVAGEPYSWQVTGSEVNEMWCDFMRDNKLLYSDKDHSRLDHAIEHYVGEHRDDLLSTVLLANDYSKARDGARVDSLLNLIDVAARPASLVGDMVLLRQPLFSSPVVHLASFRLYDYQSSSYVEQSLHGHWTLLVCWTYVMDERSRLFAQLNELVERHPNLMVADVCLEADTLSWRGRVKGDKGAWKSHYWAPAGPVEPSIVALDIAATPHCAVIDTAGVVQYNGNDVARACATIDRLMP